MCYFCPNFVPWFFSYHQNNEMSTALYSTFFVKREHICIFVFILKNDVHFTQMLFLDSLVFIWTMATALYIDAWYDSIQHSSHRIMVDQKETAFFSLNIKIEISWKTLLNFCCMWQYISRTYQVQCVQENIVSIVIVTQKQFSFLKPLFSAHETVYSTCTSY